MAVEARWSDCLFVVVPGIGGSVLEHARHGGTEVVWGGLGQLPERVLSPTLLRVAADDGIRAVGAISDWCVLRDFTVLHGYGGLVRTIANASGLKVDWGHPDAEDLSAQVVVFPYDFRRSVEHAADGLDSMIRRRLSALGTSMGDRHARVVIVAHSMGGLVARAWARRSEPSGWCRAIVTLGTPHLGAPKALSFMQSGLQVGPLPVARRLSRVIQSWASTHELLPVYRMINAGGSQPLRAVDFEAGWLDATATAAAHQVHTEIRTDWVKLGAAAPMLVPMFGVGRPTIGRATLRNGSLRFAKGPSGPEDLLGDGTVPREAAVPYELDNPQGIAAQRMEIGAAHGRLPNWGRLRDELATIVTLRPSGVLLGDGDRALALDLEGTWPSDTPLPLEVRSFDEHAMTPTPTDPARLATVQARVTAVGATPGRWMDLVRRDDHWAGNLGPVAPGAVDVEVRTSATTGDEPRAIERVQVVSAHAIEQLDGTEDGE